MRFEEVLQLKESLPVRHDLAVFLASREIRGLNWPSDVVEQWLFTHCHNSSFRRDYGALELDALRWRLETLTTELLMGVETGPSDSEYIEEIAQAPDHWISVRDSGVHEGVAEMWATHGTWKRWPLLIERSCLPSGGEGLQLIEGRTRVGVMRGRVRQGDHVAPAHLAWVARARRPK